MEFDHSLMLNFLSIFGAILFTFATSITVFVKLKRRWPVSVNCWFCNSNIKVWRQQLNWWFCSSCEQYNGFTKDGDYAYDIPERYESPMHSSTQYCKIRTGEGGSDCSSNDLCYECNRNEEFKLSELRRFEGSGSRHYDSEVKQLKHNLEEKYPLCKTCERSVQNVLRKQARWLTYYKMLFFKQKSLGNILRNRKRSEDIFRTLSTVLTAALLYNNQLLSIPIGGLLLQLCICWANSMGKKRYDAVLTFLWCCITVLMTSPGIQFSTTEVKNSMFFFGYLTHHNMVLAIALVIGFMNMLHKSYGRNSIKSISLKKMRLHSTCPTTEDSFGSELGISDHESQEDSTFKCLNQSVTRVSKTPIFRSPTPISSEPVPSPKQSIVQGSVTLTSINNSNRHYNSSGKLGSAPAFSLNDSLTTLSALSLSETLPKYTSRSAKMFEKRIYGTGSSSDLFRKLNNTGRRHILSPPKLKSVLQTSWVAGGYWQEGMDTPSLSRSSSQSSGFGSGGSNFAPSREPSVHEFDRCSVMSDTNQSCYGPKSIASYQTLSSLYYPNTRNPLTHDHRAFVQQPQHVPAPTHFQNNISPYNGGLCLPQSQRTESAGKSCAEAPVCSNHTTTIITTSPMWLSTLLCCSVIVNAIVLCTTFLR